MPVLGTHHRESPAWARGNVCPCSSCLAEAPLYCAHPNPSRVPHLHPHCRRGLRMSVSRGDWQGHSCGHPAGLCAGQSPPDAQGGAQQGPSSCGVGWEPCRPIGHSPSLQGCSGSCFVGFGLFIHRDRAPLFGDYSTGHILSLTNFRSLCTTWGLCSLGTVL